jgi:hypothetical protein
MAKLIPGDRVGYAAKFLKDTGQFTGAAPLRRGTYLGEYDGAPNMGRVKWDDQEARIAEGAGQFAEPDYCDYVREKGELVGLKAIAKVNSPRFSCNDL